jgi:hypothetical protein
MLVVCGCPPVACGCAAAPCTPAPRRNSSKLSGSSAVTSE